MEWVKIDRATLAVLERRTDKDEFTNQARHKASCWLPVSKDAKPAYDPQVQTCTATVVQTELGVPPALMPIGATRTEGWTVADKPLADMKAARVQQAKDEADKRLRAQYNQLDEIWGVCRGVQLLKKKAIDGSNLTAGETNTMTAILDGLAWVDALRDDRQALISAINGMDATQLKALDVTAAEHWD